MADEWELPCASTEAACPDAQRCLIAKRKEVGALMFDRELLTTPRASSSSLFPLERHGPCHNPDTSLVPNFRSGGERFAVCNGWDIAWSERTGGDWLAKITSAVDRATGKKKMLDVSRWQALTFRQQVGLIRQEHISYNCDLTVIEEAGAQSIWVQEAGHEEELDFVDDRGEELLGELKDIRVVGHGASDKRDFAKGVPGLILDLDAKRWEFPFLEGSYHHDEMLNFIIELEAFGWNEDRLEGVGEHDDTVMAWWHNDWGLNYLKGNLTRSASPAGRSLGVVG